MNKRTLFSLLTIGVVAVMAVGATVAYFSDTETSTGNSFTAGAIDLKIDNTSSYNGMPREDLSWTMDDLDGHLFFEYGDMKPGDWGEDTVGIHVHDNPAYACVDLWLTKDDDMSSTEPELKDDVAEDPSDIWDGELAGELHFAFWSDDGDNVYEPYKGEELLLLGPASEARDGLTYALADADENYVGGDSGEPLDGDTTYYIGKFWCYGELTPMDRMGDIAVTNGDNGMANGFYCDGSTTYNVSQTDNAMADISFYAVQARHNEGFQCERHYTPEDMLGQNLENKDDDWQVKDDDTWGNFVYSTNAGTFYGTVMGQNLEPSSKYQITLNGPGGCTDTDKMLASAGTNLFESGYWNWGNVNLSSTCQSDNGGQGVYNMNLINDHYTVMTNADGDFSYAFSLSLPSGSYSDVKVLVKKMLDEHVSPWVDETTEHTTNLYETAAVSFTVN